jgi:hypothetical protein
VGSDGSSSSIEGPPLIPSPWLMVLDSELMLVVASLSCVHVESSSSAHSRSELELNSIFKRWVFVFDDDSEVRNLNELPSLVGTVVAVPENDMSVVRVVTTMNVEALTTVVSDVSSVSTIDSDFLVDLSSPLSDNSGLTDVKSLTGLVGEGVVSSQESSDGSGS